MNTITDNEVAAIMLLATGIFLICIAAIGALVWYSHHNRTDYQDNSTDNLPDTILDKWTYNEKTGY
jgi:hypothetical protein